jgi:hypothetical protein
MTIIHNNIEKDIKDKELLRLELVLGKMKIIESLYEKKSKSLVKALCKEVGIELVESQADP